MHIWFFISSQYSVPVPFSPSQFITSCPTRGNFGFLSNMLLFRSILKLNSCLQQKSDNAIGTKALVSVYNLPTSTPRLSPWCSCQFILLQHGLRSSGSYPHIHLTAVLKHWAGSEKWPMFSKSSTLFITSRTPATTILSYPYRSQNVLWI